MKIFLLITTLINAVLLNACATVSNTSTPVQAEDLLKDRRTHNIIVSDNEIESDAYEELNDDPDIKQYCHININAYNGATLITGEAPSEALKTKVLATVQVIKNVKLIHDHLSIAEPSDLGSQENDLLITQTVKKPCGIAFARKNIFDFIPYIATASYASILE